MVNLQGFCNAEMPRFRQAGVGEEELKTKGQETLCVLVGKQVEGWATGFWFPSAIVLQLCKLKQFT